MSSPRSTTVIRLTRRNVTVLGVSAGIALVGLGGGAAIALSDSEPDPPTPRPQQTTQQNPRPQAPQTTTTASGGGRTSGAPAPGETPTTTDATPSTQDPTGLAEMPTPADVFGADLTTATSTREGVDGDTPFTTYFFEFDDGTMVSAVDDGNDGTVDTVACDLDGDGEPDYLNVAEDAASSWMPV